MANDKAAIKAFHGLIEGREKTLAQHRKVLAAAESLSEKFSNLEDAKRDRADLENQHEQIDRLRLRTKQARVAATLIPLEAAAAGARDDQAEAQKAHEVAETAFAKAESARTAAQGTLTQTTRETPQREAAAEKVQELERWKATLDQTDALKKSLAEPPRRN